MKLKERSWAKLSEPEKIANVLYPDLAGAERQKEMAEIAQANGKRAPHRSTLLSDQERGATSPLGGAAQPSKRQP
jgi:hypothetical protein